MGSGKTTLGLRLAQRLGRLFVDSDEQLKRRFGMSGRELEAASGTDALHAAEVEALLQALRTDEPSVVAAAGAVADSHDAVAALARSDLAIVVLDSPIDVLTERMPEGDHRRSLSVDQFTSLTNRRKVVLSSLAPIAVVDTSAMTPEAAIEQIMQAIHQRSVTPSANSQIGTRLDDST
jgi:shikimate kinase